MKFIWVKEFKYNFKSSINGDKDTKLIFYCCQMKRKHTRALKMGCNFYVRMLCTKQANINTRAFQQECNELTHSIKSFKMYTQV